MVKRLDNPKAILVLAGYSGDEGGDYETKLKKLVKKEELRCHFIGHRINSHRRIVRVSNGIKPERGRVYTLWDCFANADFVTYPTKIEGFGNQFVETVYFRKPIILTPYPVYKKDIKPLGFETVEMPDKVTEKVVAKVEKLIANPRKGREMVEKNFKLGRKYLSYDWVEKELKTVMKNLK